MNYLSRRCKSILPYTAGEQPQDKSYVKLNTNECPYPPSPEVEKTLKEFDAGRLRLYPDPENKKLVSAIAARHGVSSENVFVGNGSDEVLCMCFPAFFDENDTVAYADVTYSFYKVWAHMYDVKSKKIPLDDEFKLLASDYLSMDGVKGIIICNPNAPTGTALGRLDLLKIVETNPDKIVIVDEAYGEFASASVANRINDYPNLLVVKTFSKAYALAGARCGYALGNKALIDGLKLVKNSMNSYTVNALTEAIVIAALSDKKYYADVIDKINAQREETADALRELGFEVLPSSSNFIFAKHKVLSGSEIYFQLKENGVLVRHFKGDRISDFARITIGTHEEMKTLVSEIKKIIKH